MSDTIPTNVMAAASFDAANNNTLQLRQSDILGHSDGYGLKEPSIVTRDGDHHPHQGTVITFDM